jgi:hypothetical protein
MAGLNCFRSHGDIKVSNFFKMVAAVIVLFHVTAAHSETKPLFPYLKSFEGTTVVVKSKLFAVTGLRGVVQDTGGEFDTYELLVQDESRFKRFSRYAIECADIVCTTTVRLWLSKPISGYELEFLDYSAGQAPNSIDLSELSKRYSGQSVAYEGKINWGSVLDDTSVGPSFEETISLDFSELPKKQKLWLLDHCFEKCDTLQIEGTTNFQGVVLSVLVNTISPSKLADGSFASTSIVSSGDLEAGEKAYGEKDYTTAFRNWRPLAEQGDANVQFYIGYMYLHGQGVDQNLEEAVVWYLKSADQKHGDSLVSLFELLKNDKREKVLLLIEENANHSSGYEIGNYTMEEGDFEAAARILKPLAEQGNPKAQFDFAQLLQHGSGVSKNISDALKWYRAASKNGHHRAMISLAYHLSRGCSEFRVTGIV